MAKGRRTTIISVRVPDNIKAIVEGLANEREVTTNDWLKTAIVRYAVLSLGIKEGSLEGIILDGCGRVLKLSPRGGYTELRRRL